MLPEHQDMKFLVGVAVGSFLVGGLVVHIGNKILNISNQEPNGLSKARRLIITKTSMVNSKTSQHSNTSEQQQAVTAENSDEKSATETKCQTTTATNLKQPKANSQQSLNPLSKLLSTSKPTIVSIDSSTTDFADGKQHLQLNNIDFKSYILQNSLREPVILKQMRDFNAQNIGTVDVDPISGQFLRLILNMIDAKKCIEVAPLTWYNILNCVLTIPDSGTVIVLDTTVNQNVMHDHPIFKKSKVTHKVIVRSGNSIQSMDAMLVEGHRDSVDFISFNAENVNDMKYVDRALRLLRVGGIIAIRNTLHGANRKCSNEDDAGTEKLLNSCEKIRQLNLKIKLDNRFQLSFLNIGNGMSICRKI